MPNYGIVGLASFTVLHEPTTGCGSDKGTDDILRILGRQRDSTRPRLPLRVRLRKAFDAYRRASMRDAPQPGKRSPLVGGADRFSDSRRQDPPARTGRGRQHGPGSGGVTSSGILDSRILPDSEFATLWESLVFEDDLKDRLLSQAVLNFTLRGKIDRAHLPLHGIIVLAGPPGTGKTSLARGLASATAGIISGIGQFLYLEVDPHSLASAALGQEPKGRDGTARLHGRGVRRHASADRAARRGRDARG